MDGPERVTIQHLHDIMADGLVNNHGQSDIRSDTNGNEVRFTIWATRQEVRITLTNH